MQGSVSCCCSSPVMTAASAALQIGYTLQHPSVVTQERDTLLPAVSTLLRATPAEFTALRSAVVEGGVWWPAMGC